MSTVPVCTLCDLPVHQHYDPETGKVCWMDGHSAQPLKGRVCDACQKIVFALRFGLPAPPTLTELRILGKAERAAFDTEASA